jgi:multidrug efflux pump subunit AcrA (membrane-fusion protein)
MPNTPPPTAAADNPTPPPADLQRQLDEARATITALERRQRIDAQLAQADASDLEAARLLTEAAVAQMDDPDVELAVRDLREHRPYLFHRRPPTAPPPPAGSPEPEDGADPDPATHAAAEARATGDRRDLLRYLRLKRGP